jgi:hypothetical protein
VVLQTASSYRAFRIQVYRGRHTRLRNRKFWTISTLYMPDYIFQTTRKTPQTTMATDFYGFSAPSPCSSASSCTLSSTDITSADHAEIETGDLVAIKCRLRRKDCPRPSSDSSFGFVRVSIFSYFLDASLILRQMYTVEASRVEIVV